MQLNQSFCYDESKDGRKGIRVAHVGSTVRANVCRISRELGIYFVHVRYPASINTSSFCGAARMIPAPVPVPSVSGLAMRAANRITMHGSMYVLHFQYKTMHALSVLSIELPSEGESWATALHSRTNA